MCEADRKNLSRDLPPRSRSGSQPARLRTFSGNVSTGVSSVANPHKEQRRREAANEQGLHESSDTQHRDWTDLEEDRDQGDENRQHNHHPADERHTNEYGNAADRDRERRARRRDDPDASSGRQHGRTERGPNHDETGHGHANRWGSNRTTGDEASEYSERGRRRTGEHGGREGRGAHEGRSSDEGHDTGSPRTGSQRGSHREEGISGRMTGQRGSPDRHSDPSDSTFRDETHGEREHRHGGERGTSERDRRYGSRRGHGSERETDRRHSSH
jgi:hypothetical protein